MQLHNDFGSWGLIDTLHACGFCISYDELRHLLTSAAEEEMKRIKEGVYIPTGIIPRNEGGNLIHEGDDNIDINAEIIDGKNTFHAMKHVVFKDKSPDLCISFPSFPCRKRKSLQLSDEIVSLTRAESFKKPPKRAEPPSVKLHHCQSQLLSQSTGLFHFGQNIMHT